MRHPLYDRMGTFEIKKSDLDALPDWLQQLLARVIVLRAQYSYRVDGNEYLALSPEFSPVPQGQAAPIYRPVIEDGRFLRWAP